MNANSTIFDSLKNEEFKSFLFSKMSPINYKTQFTITDCYCENTKTFNASIGLQYGRYLRKLNFDLIYDCPKYNSDKGNTFMSKINNFFNNGIVIDKFKTPGGIKAIEHNDWNHLWELLKVSSHRASVFNVNTFGCILNTLFDGGVLYTPCLGWNSYQLAFHNTEKFHTYIGTDVIQSVVDNGKTISELPEFKLFSDKNVELHCAPSEIIDLPHYNGTVDSILFSPPYYDLECYTDGEQSLSSYPTFNEWISNYWVKTLESCERLLKPGGKIGFVVSNYKSKHHKHGETISDTMSKVASNIFNNQSHFKIKLNNNNSTSVSKKMQNGHYEDLWVYTK